MWFGGGGGKGGKMGNYENSMHCTLRTRLGGDTPVGPKERGKVVQTFPISNIVKSGPLPKV